MDGGIERIYATITCYTDVEDHLLITNGRMYNPQLDGTTIEVIVNQQTFIEQQLMLNQEFTLDGKLSGSGAPYRLRVVGIYENSREQDPYWFTSPNSGQNIFMMDADLFQQVFVDEAMLKEGFYKKWYAVLDYTAFDGELTEEYLQVLDSCQKALKDMGVTFSIQFQSTMQSFVPELQKLTTTVWVLLLPIFVLLAAFVFMVSRQMLEMEENEIAVYKSRGANRGQILLVYLLQSLCIAAVSMAGGIPLGMFICQILGASNSFLEFVQRTALPVSVDKTIWIIAGAASLFSVCTMVLPAFRYANVSIVDHKRQKNRVNRRPWWQTFFLDIILLGVAVYGLYQYNGQKELLAQKVLEGEALDPLLYLCSSLFMVGCALVILRIFPLVLKLIFQIGKRWWSPALYTSFLRIIRTRSNQGFLMVFLILTVSMGIFNAQTARTINANAEEKIRYMAGADLVVREVWSNNKDQLAEYKAMSGVLTPSESKVVYSEPNYDKYLTIDGIRSVTKVLYDHQVSVSIDKGKVDNVLLLGIHTKEFAQTAWFKESLLPYHYHEYLNAISTNPAAILVSSNFRELHDYRVGDVLYYSSSDHGSLRGIIYGFVDYWPGYAPVTVSKGEDGLFRETDNYLVVANLSQLQSIWGITPYQVWIDAEDSTQFLYDYAQEQEIRYELFEDASAQLVDKKNDPIFQGTNGILTIGFICILLLCTIGFLIYWILSIQSRTLQFGIFRAMGMTMREIFTMLINEQIFITGVSIGLGILVGIFTSRLFVPLIQIAYSSADQVIPIEIISESSDYVRLFAVIGFVILLCMVVLGVLISRIKISQALKLGED